jgi:hypothetical protein
MKIGNERIEVSDFVNPFLWPSTGKHTPTEAKKSGKARERERERDGKWLTKKGTFYIYNLIIYKRFEFKSSEIRVVLWIFEDGLYKKVDLIAAGLFQQFSFLIFSM